MAGLVVCDFCEEGSFVPAVAHVSASRIENHTVTPIHSKDACLKHMEKAVVDCWGRGFVVANFHEVRINPV